MPPLLLRHLHRQNLKDLRTKLSTKHHIPSLLLRRWFLYRVLLTAYVVLALRVRLVAMLPADPVLPELAASSAWTVHAAISIDLEPGTASKSAAFQWAQQIVSMEE